MENLFINIRQLRIFSNLSFVENKIRNKSNIANKLAFS